MKKKTAVFNNVYGGKNFTLMKRKCLDYLSAIISESDSYAYCSAMICESI